MAAIGCRNHAAKVISLVESGEGAEVTCLYHPQGKIDDPRGTSDLSAILASDAVFILSPNATHFPYLHYLREQGYSGYIFCEKPPVTTASDLAHLRRFPSERLFFNFNLRFGALASAILEALKSGELGKLVHLSAVVTHGLAYRESFSGSWRALRESHPKSVFESVSIHFIDLFQWVAGPLLSLENEFSIVAQRGTAWDTCKTDMVHESGASACIVSSYAAPYLLHVLVIGTNGVIELRDGELTVSSPRDTFDETGLFMSPPAQRRMVLEPRDLFAESLPHAVRFFLNHCAALIPIPPLFFERSLASTDWLLR